MSKGLRDALDEVLERLAIIIVENEDEINKLDEKEALPIFEIEERVRSFKEQLDVAISRE